MIWSTTQKEQLKLTLIFLGSKLVVWLLGREIFLKLLKMGMNYGVQKHLEIRPIETFLTRDYPGYTKHQEESLLLKKYYKFNETQDLNARMDYRIVYSKVPEIRGLVREIVEEHHAMTKGVDQNLHYLWHLYHHGTKAGDYRPFILLAEIQLLKALGYITEDEAYNMSNMMQSNDFDNLSLVCLSIRTLRKNRIEEHGQWGVALVSVKLKDIIEHYPLSIMSPKLFTDAFTKPTTPYSV